MTGAILYVLVIFSMAAESVPDVYVFASMPACEAQAQRIRARAKQRGADLFTHCVTRVVE